MAAVEVIKASRKRTPSSPAGVSVEKLKVAAYCRVSTDNDEQLESYKSQVEYYTTVIHENPDWVLVDIYADEAITGTMVDKRENFQRMISDCMNGKIDLIITKSISRFARNTLDVLKYVRLLKEKRIGIKFEEEKINTLSMDGELLLAVLSAVYQQEVENTSANVKKGLRMKMQRGELVGFQGCLGYDYDPNTKSISINKEEAEIVRFIFRMYLKGYGCEAIGRELRKRGWKTKRGKTSWPNSAVLGILKNEKYKGDILMGKTFTVDPINKKRLANMGDVDQFYIRDHHEAIISAGEFERAREIREARSRKQHGQKGVDGVNFRGAVRYTFSQIIECGFCGATLCRRSWHAGSSKYRRVVWQCIEATKNGKKNCPHSKGILEEAIEKAFVQSYKETCHVNKNLLEETIKRLKQSLQNDSYEEKIREAEKEVKSYERQIDRLLDLQLEQKISEEVYVDKFKKLSAKVEHAKERREKLSLALSKQENYERRIAKIRKLLESHEVLEEFDADVFLSTVKKVIVGGIDEEGNIDPYLIKFIYKTGVTDPQDGGSFKPPRRNASKKGRDSSKPEMTASNQASIMVETKGHDELSSLPTHDAAKMCILPSLTTCGDRGLDVKSERVRKPQKA